MNVTIPCICPPDGARHPEGDTVVLRDRLNFVQTQTARNAIALARSDEDGIATEEALALLTEQYVLLGVESWSVVGPITDEHGRTKDGPVPVTRRTLREYLLENEDAEEAASMIADEADGLYSRKVMLPLIERASNSSQATPTTPSTSPTPGSGADSEDQSSRSSISTIPTADTGTTSKRRGGDSSSSRSSTSAA